MKVRNGTLNVLKKVLWERENVTEEDCAKKCFSEKNCLSFEVDKEYKNCYLSRETADTSKKMKSAKSSDYYQRVKCNYSLCFSFLQICGSICFGECYMVNQLFVYNACMSNLCLHGKRMLNDYDVDDDEDNHLKQIVH